MKSVLLVFFCIVAAPATIAFAGSPAPIGKSEAPVARSGGLRISGGFLSRSIEGVSWHTGTQSTPAMFSIGAGSSTAGIDAIGAADAFADRLYRDGFVNMDGGTVEGEPAGLTWNWGYTGASQVSGSVLSYHGGNGTSAEFDQDSGYEFGGWSSDLDGTAPYVEMEWIEPLRGNWSWGVEAGISILNTSAGRNLSTFSAEKSRIDYSILYTDEYETGGIIVPQAPYAGSMNGPGALIPNIPFRRTPVYTVSGGERADAYNAIQADFDMTLSTISLGPVLEYRTPFCSIQASAGLTLNIVDWEASQNEQLYVRRDGGAPVLQRQWSHVRNDTDFLAGIFVQASVLRQLNDQWFFTVSGRYDAVHTLSIEAGPSTGDVDVSGWSVGAAVGVNF